MIFRNRILKDENHDIGKELNVWRAAAEGVDGLSIELYRKRFGYTKENMLEEYFELREVFFEKFEELNLQEQKIQLTSLLNDSAYLRRNSKIELKEIFPVYKFGLDSKLILDHGKISQTKYITIVTIANKIGEFQFTKSFIQNYTSNLSPEIQKDADKWAKANLAYSSKQLSKCFELLKVEDFKIHFFKLAG